MKPYRIEEKVDKYLDKTDIQKYILKSSFFKNSEKKRAVRRYYKKKERTRVKRELKECLNDIINQN